MTAPLTPASAYGAIEQSVIASVTALPLFGRIAVLRAISDSLTDYPTADSLSDIADAIEQEARDNDAAANGWWPEIVLGEARSPRAMTERLHRMNGGTSRG